MHAISRCAYRCAYRCAEAYRRFLATTSKAISQDWDRQYVDDLNLFGAAGPQANLRVAGHLAEYMNRPDVRAALHVDASPARTLRMD